MVFVCLFSVYFLVTLPSVGALFVRGGHSLKKYYVTVYGPILMLFPFFFGTDCPFRWTGDCPFLPSGGTTIYAKLLSKIAKTPEIGGKVCAHIFL